MPYATTITPHPPERRPSRALPGLIPAALANAAIEERFAAYIAHELRTPLTTQRALLELALTDPLADTDSWRDVAEDVLDACLQQERLLEACLTLARSRQGLRRRDRIDLAAIAHEALRANDRSGLDSMFALEPAEIRGDAVLVDRLATNLVSNAIRHTRPGGRIEIATRAQAGRAYLIVANTGPRIPAAVAASESRFSSRPYRHEAGPPPEKRFRTGRSRVSAPHSSPRRSRRRRKQAG